MAIAMPVVGLSCGRRRGAVLAAGDRVLGAVHFAAPHTLGSLYHSFCPAAASSQLADARGGAVGSGRVADIGAGLGAGSRRRSSGTGSARASDARCRTSPGAIVDPKTGAPIIFDDQYMNSLVSIGFVGLSACSGSSGAACAGWSQTARRLRRAGAVT